MKKRVLIVFILLIGIFGVLNKEKIKLAFDFSPVKINGDAAVLMDEKTGKVIYSKNQHSKLYPASTTKLLTALVVLEHTSIDEKVTIGREVFLNTEEEASAGLFEGQVQSVEELLAAMLLQSGNDAARSLAIFTAQKNNGKQLSLEEALKYFARLMNDKARDIGASESHFINPHGLHDSNHYSTAWDLAMIAKEAKQNNVIESIVNQQSYSTQTHTYANRNKLLNSDSEYFYEAATGLKTGFTDQAGYCLVSSAEQNGQELIAVVLHSGKETMWSDSISLLDYGFGNGNF
ncbi:D-alanyl-D-alanine carboxypeptidase family protein [Bacillus sp. FSL K6-3431]|uniref:D-alanyl-D-alanine carboxypeptidase family protein n=1 Tax=Bacillus sp. FSL K6-3431 TaxID=2921500 RepID=UPI0030F4F9E5